MRISKAVPFVAAIAMLGATIAPAQDGAADDSSVLDELLWVDESESRATDRSGAPDGDTPSDDAGPGSTDEADAGTYDTIPVRRVDERTEAARASEPRRPASRLVEEIVVTAQKREENIQDVPISIQAFTPGVLDARGVQNAQDLPLITPGLTVTQQVGSVSTYIRGVGSDTFTLGEPSVATYVDEIYYPMSTGGIQNFGTIKRIEVLKGPQGTLFGRNAVGGAINIITEDPDLDQVRASAQVQFGNYDTIDARGYLSAPLADSVGVSISGFRNESDYYLDGTADGEPLPGPVEQGARGKLLWSPSERFEIVLAAAMLDSKFINPGANTEPSQILGALIPPQDPRNANYSQKIPAHNEVESYYVRAKAFFDGFDLKVFGSRLTSDIALNYDFDGSSLPLVDFNTLSLASTSHSAEIQLTSTDQGWAASWLKWVAGLYYFDAEQGFNPTYARIGNLSLDPDVVAEYELLGLGDLLSPVLDLVDGLAAFPTGEVNIIAVIGTSAIAGYAQATATLTDWFDITLGGRYQSEERFCVECSSGLRNSDGSVGIKFNDFDKNSPGARSRTNSFNPKVSLDFRPSWSWLGDEPLLYASWQRATKSATYNVVTILPVSSLEYLPPERITTWEMGIKTRVFGGASTFNAAVFHNEIDNAQVQFASLLAGGTITFQSADQRIIGAEFDLLTPVLPSLVDGLYLTVGAAFLDPEYTEFRDAKGFDETTGLYSENNDYTGNQITRVPEVQLSVSLSQTLAVPGGTLEAAADYSYLSEYYFLPQSTDNTKQDAYGIVGARVSYLYEPWNLRVTAYGRNITDEDYYYGRFITDFGTLDTMAPLALYGLRMNWEF